MVGSRRADACADVRAGRVGACDGMASVEDGERGPSRRRGITAVGFGGGAGGLTGATIEGRQNRQRRRKRELLLLFAVDWAGGVVGLAFGSGRRLVLRACGGCHLTERGNSGRSGPLSAPETTASNRGSLVRSRRRSFSLTAVAVAVAVAVPGNGRGLRWRDLCCLKLKNGRKGEGKPQRDLSSLCLPTSDCFKVLDRDIVKMPGRRTPKDESNY
ncbi:hypothetical protein BHM03_00034186 [Ensete ventricosum]|nr:hypothetical protein BHM03_00034186 [Ensete ventricosum]